MLIMKSSEKFWYFTEFSPGLLHYMAKNLYIYLHKAQII